MTRPTRQSGVSLIEVLVSVAILSFSLLGLAALQGSGLSFTHESYLQTQALTQAYNILDRMRANPVGAGNDSYLAAPPDSYPADCSRPATACDPDDLALYDLHEWEQSNDQLLPGGTGTIQSTDADGDGDDDIVVTITWQEEESATGDLESNDLTLTVDRL